MRSAEILVLSPQRELIKGYFRKICQEMIIENEDTIFGFLPIDDQIQIQLYGFTWKHDSDTIGWDRIFCKALGLLVLFDWQDTQSLAGMKEILQHFETNYTVPIMTASVLNGAQEKIPFKLYRGGLPVTNEGRFTFYHPDSLESIRELIVGLININLEIIARN